MSGLWSSVIAGAVAGAASCLLLVRFGLPAMQRSVGPGPAAPAPEPDPQPPEPAKDEPAQEAPAAPTGTIGAILPALSRKLSPLAEDIGHPHELRDMAEFQAVLTAFRRPDATLALLGQYATGGNWPMACAAFTVLAEHPERQALRDTVLLKFDELNPFAVAYALEFLAGLKDRPVVGAAVAGAARWWSGSPVVTAAYDDYFARSATAGDEPDFGDYPERIADFDAEPVRELLGKMQHPYAARLIAALRRWDETRLDRKYLGTIGTLWQSSGRDPLLVRPDAWQVLLVTALAAIRQPRPRSVLVTGDPRIGKTAFLELLGDALQEAGWTVFAAGSDELMADQQYFGQLEGRIRKLLDALHSRRKLVWFVRDLAQIGTSGMSQGQPASILDQILPAVTAGDLVIVGEAGHAAAVRLFQSRPSLRSVVEVVPLQPMSDGDTSALAMQVGERIARNNGLAVPEQAVAATIDLAQHYLGSGRMPGAVLDLLKRAASNSINAGATVLTADSVLATLSQMSGLPRVILDTGQRVELAQVRRFFAQRVIGQDEAVKAVVDRIAMLKAGLTDPGRPVGVFLFAGPTGTGKTELAKSLAEFLFGSPERMARLDMSEFQTAESTGKILGHRGESGTDSLIDRIRKQPFSVVLLDEFEKAHPNCWDLFLQIFDDGRLSDANGSEADFRHCFIILTSNLGATLHQGASLGFRPDGGTYDEGQVLRTIGQTFRPEFVNRLDKIIVFRPLTRDLMRTILHKELGRIQERRGLRERAWAVEWEASVIEFLLDRGFSPEMGARPLKRAIDQLLLAPLAATLVEHRFPQGDQFLFVRSNGREIEVEFVDPDAEPAPAPAPEAGPDGGLSLPSIILRQTGSAAERASLAAAWREIDAGMSDEAWSTQSERLRLALADPAIWSRDDRHQVFSSLEMRDRLQEAARSAERLLQRYETSGAQASRASRELAGRLALQLLNLQRGLEDSRTGAPVDVLLRVTPALEGGGDSALAAGWCRTLSGMYRQWAARRRMRIEEIAAPENRGTPILHVIGFGAFRTLGAEAGLHVLDDHRPENARRTVARVTVVGGPDRDLPVAGKFTAASRLLAAASVTATIVRRYRGEPSPLVRDIAAGWRTGRLETVLDGDFDLMADVSRAPPAEKGTRP